MLVSFCVARQFFWVCKGVAWRGLELATMVGVSSGVAVGAGTWVGGTTVGVVATVALATGPCPVVGTMVAVAVAVAGTVADPLPAGAGPLGWRAISIPTAPLAPSASTMTAA